MEYPFWDTAASYGILMAVIAVVHVFISHFAIGGGLYLVIAERMARKRDDVMALEFLQGLSRFFVLTTLVMGALTGVGIWFIIGLLNPAATELLIHNFVWGWAAEWCFFVIEILAAILYLYGWKRMSGKNHMILGWIYFGAAWMSLFIINGIITFMLTPGDWITTGNFWDGFFNVTFMPSLVIRTGISVMLAGLFALAVVSVRKASEFKARTVVQNTVWSLVGLAIMLPSAIWYFNAIPDTIMATAEETLTIPFITYGWSFYLIAAIALCLAVFGLAMRKKFVLPMALVMMLLGLAWFGSFETFRESIRKPYVVTDYMYGNAVVVNQVEEYQTAGMLPNLAYQTGDDGADLFRHACRTCHTIDSYNALKPAFDGTDEEFIAVNVLNTHVLVGNMPPFAGTEEEASMIAAHIYKQTDQRSIKEIYGLSGDAFGEKVYDVRCGNCHVIGGFNDKAETLFDMDKEELLELLEMAGDLAEEMPPFTGDEEEAEALADFILKAKAAQEGGQS